VDPQEKTGDRLEAVEREPPQEIARELGLGMSTLYTWRDRFLEAGLEGLKYGGKSKALHEAEEGLRQARQAIGKLTMELDEKKVRMEEARKKSSASSPVLHTRSR